MNQDDIAAMAKEIYIRRAAYAPHLDKENLAREAIQSAKQFFPVLRSETKHISYSTGVSPVHPPPAVDPTAHIVQQMKQHLGEQSMETNKTMGTQNCSGTDMEQQHHSGRPG